MDITRKIVGTIERIFPERSNKIVKTFKSLKKMFWDFPQDVESGEKKLSLSRILLRIAIVIVGVYGILCLFAILTYLVLIVFAALVHVLVAVIF